MTPEDEKAAARAAILYIPFTREDVLFVLEYLHATHAAGRTALAGELRAQLLGLWKVPT